MAVTLTENAAKQIRKQLAKRGKGSGVAHRRKERRLLGIRLHIRLCGRSRGRTIRCSSLLMPMWWLMLPVCRLLDGSNVDFVREGLNDSFRVRNPNVDNTCGCGESFSVKEAVKA